MTERAVLPAVEPEEVGLSPARLGILENLVTGEVEAERMPGAVIAIARGGKLAYLRAFGYRHPGKRAPMTPDTLFWIASMTKPITTVGALVLHEEGRLPLDEPLDALLPEFTDQRVAEIDAGSTRYLPAPRPPVVLDLLRHTSGIVEGLLGDTPVHAMYAEAVGDGMTDCSGQEFIERLSRLPLLHAPGTVWHYGWGLDLAGLIIEKITGVPLRSHLHQYVLGPLGMEDTAFGVPGDRHEDLALPLRRDPATGDPQFLPDLSRARFDSGGAGLVGTATDYLRFAQMLLDKGRLGSTRVLGRKTVEYMTSDQLDSGIDHHRLATMSARLDGYGFGLGLAVRRRAGLAPTAGSAGEVTWPGAAGTYWWADPKEELAVVFLTHTPARTARVRYYQLIRSAVLQTLTE
uniref:serine hydrolase domain-containing protein n=1 Tax=Actinomadura sp. CA-154981 TaxID=3240037 RepID=UPI003F4974F7